VGHVPVWDMVEAHDASRDIIEGVIEDAHDASRDMIEGVRSTEERGQSV
jgi:hypothetical protein